MRRCPSLFSFVLSNRCSSVAGRLTSGILDGKRRRRWTIIFMNPISTITRRSKPITTTFKSCSYNNLSGWLLQIRVPFRDKDFYKTKFQSFTDKRKTIFSFSPSNSTFVRLRKMARVLRENFSRGEKTSLLSSTNDRTIVRRNRTEELVPVHEVSSATVRSVHENPHVQDLRSELSRSAASSTRSFGHAAGETLPKIHSAEQSATSSSRSRRLSATRNRQIRPTELFVFETVFPHSRRSFLVDADRTNALRKASEGRSDGENRRRIFGARRSVSSSIETEVAHAFVSSGISQWRESNR